MVLVSVAFPLVPVESAGVVRLTRTLLTPPRNATFSPAFFTETFDVALYRLLRHRKQMTYQSSCFEFVSSLFDHWQKNSRLGRDKTLNQPAFRRRPG